MSTRLTWGLCIIAAVVMTVVMVLMGQVPHQLACDGDAVLPPILRFEWMTSTADLASLFGDDPCRSQLSAAMDAVNRIDVMAYIPAFTAFQLLAAWALRWDGRLLAIVAINAAIIAAGCDLLEDRTLFLMSWTARSGQVPDAALFAQLFWFVRVKFGLLAIAAILLGWLVGRRAGPGWQVARWLMVAGGTVGLAGLVWPQLLAPGIGAAWAVLMVVAIVRVIRRGPPSDVSSQPG